LTCGFAGGLNPALRTGTVLFSADLHFPWSDGLTAAGCRPGRFHCAEKVIGSAAEKRKIWQATGADAVEMESEAIRSLARARDIPSATVRVISDAADEDLPLDFNKLLNAEGRLPIGKLFCSLLGQPSSLLGLWRLRRQTRLAARRLAAVLHPLLPGP